MSASTITQVSTNIDITYPIAGIDNNSNGFRTNFSLIQQSFAVADAEISNLDANTVKTNANNTFGSGFVNNFNNATVQRPRLQNERYIVSLNTGSSTLDYSAGSFHKREPVDSTTYTVSNWPTTGLYAVMRVSVAPRTANTTTISFSNGSSPIFKDASTTLPYTATSTATVVWDLWSIDGGSTVFVQHVGGPYSTF